MKIPTQILLILILISCQRSDEIPPLDENIDFNNSIFYSTLKIDGTDNNKNIRSFYVYNLKNKQKIKLPIELAFWEIYYQLENDKLFFIQYKLLRSYDLRTKLIETHFSDVPPRTDIHGASLDYYSVTHDQNYFAYYNNDESHVIIVDLNTGNILDTLETNASGLSWAPTKNILLIESTPSKLYDLDSKSIISTLENNEPLSKQQWANGDEYLFYHLSPTGYVLHKLIDNSISELNTSEMYEIHQGKLSLENKYFGYVHTPRNYIGNFHYLDLTTNEDTFINNNYFINDFRWFPSSDSVVFSDSQSFYIYDLKNKSSKGPIDITTNTNEYIEFFKPLLN